MGRMDNDGSTDFLAQGQAAEVSSHNLVVAFEGFDGPIDLLLALAREQKVDLSKLSILALAEQYLAYIETGRAMRLEIAADYLVMAAWLAFLKSRLLLPEPPEDEADAAAMADALKFQLLRLEAMQKASRAILDGPQLGADFFMRGAPEPMDVEERPTYYLPFYDLLSALGAPQRRRRPEHYDVAPTRLYSLEESLTRLRRMLGGLPSWGSLQMFLPNMFGHDDLETRSAIASTFAAILEMVKEGEMDVRQSQAFATVYIKNRKADETRTTETTL